MKKHNFSLNDTVMSFRDGMGQTDITLERCLSNFLIMGSTGSGKSRTSGALLASNLLRQGCGALVLCVKSNEAKRFMSICDHVGRGKDVVHVHVKGIHAFDFLRYLCRPHYDGKSITANIVSTLKAVINADDRSSGRENEAYWSNAVDELLTNVVDLGILAKGTVTVDDLYEIIAGAPKPSDAPLESSFDRQFQHLMEAAQRNVNGQIFQYIDHLSNDEKERLKDPEAFAQEIRSRFADARTLTNIERFFYETYRNLSGKTRSIVQSSCSGLLFRLMQDPVYSIFASGKTTFSPEDVYAGRIIILDIPILTYGKVAQECQRLFKYIFQEAMKRRVLDDDARVVVCWQDEGHMLMLEGDANFYSISREHRVANVLITQNLSNLHQNLSGAKADHQVHSIVSVLSNKLLHANDHVESNEWATRLIGQAYTDDYSFGDSFHGTLSTSRNHAYKLEALVRPEEFLHLTGASRESLTAEAYVVLQGMTFHDGLHHRKVVFKQHNF